MAKPPADSTIRRVVEHLTDTDTLDEHGLHTDDSCRENLETAQAAAEAVEADLAEVIGELHRQAHPGEPRLVMYCRLEPCRSVPMDYPAVGIA